MIKFKLPMVSTAALGVSDRYNTDHRTMTGGRLNKKDGLTRYGDSHVKDKTS